MTTLGPVKLSYCNVWKPGKTPQGTLRYSCACLFPEEDKALEKKVNEAIQEAISTSLEKNKFPKSALPILKKPLRNGTTEFETGQRGEEYNGMLYFNCGNEEQPEIVDTNLDPVMDEKEVYSGVWAYVDVSFFGFNQSGNKGIGVSLNSIMKFKDDKRIDGRKSAKQAFGGLKLPDIPEESGDMT